MATAFTLNDQVANSSTTINSGVYVQQYANNTTLASYVKLVTISAPVNSGTGQGYNNSAAITMDQNKAGNAVLLSQIPKVNGYYQFLVDVKSADASLVTFTKLQIYGSVDANTNISDPTLIGNLVGSSGIVAFDLGASNSLAVTIKATSNRSQFAIYVPTADFGSFGGANEGSTSIYIYGMANGMTSKDFIFAYDTANATTPEAHTVWGGVSMGLLLCAGYVRKRFAKLTPVS